MRIDMIPVGDNPPESLNVIIEVPTGGEPVKYEFDKESGALFVDRILHTPMRYPANYGFVPHTLSDDGDPLDALVISRSPFIPGCVVRARPIGVLNLEDEHGGDEKLICVPVDTTFPYYSDVGQTKDLPSIIFQQIEHFFTHYKDLEAEIGEEAGRRAVARLNAGSMPSGKYPVVFDPRIGGGLVGHLLGAIGAPAVARKSTFLLGREEDELFDPSIRILEEPLRKRGVRSRPFDGEGVACTSRAIIDRGRLTGWLTNVASADQLGLGLTGHAARASGGSPGVSASNVHLEAGSVSPEELMADIEDGLYVTGLYGQGVNMVTGDYSRGATGFRIRNGEFAGAVSEITIAGHLASMFRGLTPANDLEMYRSVNVPTLRIDGMTVAGG
ncbi:MAG: inorganic diphosphatase [Erythrobacter sp.]|nr:inorganic diphosphatase [Erythrobacter sp.]